MTDRELLDSIDAQIKAHKEANPEDPTTNPVEPNDDLVVIPRLGNFKPPKGNFDGWVWPMPTWQGMECKVSDGFSRHKTARKRQHLGSDLMYRNERRMKRNLPETTPWYHCPSDTVPMMAMGPGHVWFAGKTSTGWTVKIDHGLSVGFPLVTYYTHMSKLLIPEHSEGPDGIEVGPGDQIGYVGNSPKGEDPNHAHIEFWDYSHLHASRMELCLDPWLYLRCMGQVALP